jgi:hypothetical protein
MLHYVFHQELFDAIHVSLYFSSLILYSIDFCQKLTTCVITLISIECKAKFSIALRSIHGPFTVGVLLLGV